MTPAKAPTNPPAQPPGDGEPDLVLDCRGLRCPLPVIELARHIGDVPVGSAIRVLADDPAAPNDIAAWCRMRSQDYIGQSTIDNAGATASDLRRTQ